MTSEIIEEMTREEAVTHLAALCQFIHGQAFIEEFSQSARGGKRATLIGFEVKDKEAGLALLASLDALSKQVRILPPDQQVQP